MSRSRFGWPLSSVRMLGSGILVLSCWACTAWGGKPPISPQRKAYPSAAGASALAPIPMKTVIATRGHGHAARDGIVIPVPEARRTVFRYLSRVPVLLMDATVVDGAGHVQDTPAILKTVGPVLLSDGLELGTQCPEHLRIGDSVAHGAFCNGGHSAIRLQLGNGLVVKLKPDQGIYVGDDFYAVKVYDQLTAAPASGQGGNSRSATHTIECVCTCHADSGDEEENRFACGSRCIDPGNQCEGLDGNGCTVTDDQGKPQHGQEQNCHEEVVPLETDDWPAGAAQPIGAQPH